MRICPDCEQTFGDDVRRCPTDGSPTVSLPDKPLEKLVGASLDGRWRIGRLLGEGGMGAVFEGRQINLDRPVAIKILQPELAQRDLIIARFMREARVMSALRHPHIVTILDFGRDEVHGLLYLVMELLEGQPLNVWLQRNRPSYQQVLDIVEQTARALTCAHDNAVIHRDLKPHNIFLTPMGASFHLKVLDFGIAKLQAPDASTLTNTGDIQGTPHYMAPEQISAEPIVPQTDLYALGVMLYELITGRVPFEAPSALPIFFKHCHEPPPPIEGRWALEVPPQPALIALTLSLLEKSPAGRPASAAALIEQLGTLRTPDLTLSWDVQLPALASTLDMRSAPLLQAGKPPASMATPAAMAAPELHAQPTYEQAPAPLVLDKQQLAAVTHQRAAPERPNLMAAGAFGVGAAGLVIGLLAIIAVGLAATTSLNKKPTVAEAPAVIAQPSPTPPVDKPAIKAPDEQPPAEPVAKPAAIVDAAPDLPTRAETNIKIDKKIKKKKPTEDELLRELNKVNFK